MNAQYDKARLASSMFIGIDTPTEETVRDYIDFVVDYLNGQSGFQLDAAARELIFQDITARVPVVMELGSHTK